MKSQYYANIIRYLYYILFFFLPFVVLPVSSELFEFNKMLFIYTISAFIASTWLLRSFQEKRLVIKKTSFDIPLSIFILSQVMSTIFSIDQHTSFFGYYGRFNGGLLSTLTYIFLYYGFVSNVDKNINKTIKTILGISIFSSILVVAWGLPGKFNRDLSCLLFTGQFNNSCWTAQFKPAERMFSTLGQPNWLGAYLAITFFMSIFVLITSQAKKAKVIGALGILFSYIGILLSRSRSSLVSLAPGFICIGIYFLFLLVLKSSWMSSLRKKILIGIMVFLVFLTFFIQTGIGEVDSLLHFSFLKKYNTPQTQTTVVTPKVDTSLQVVGPITESLDIRKIVWKGAWELGQQYPLFGTGVETFGYAYYSVRPVAHNLTSEWDFLYNKAHNEYLNLLATTGWFGLGSFILLLLWMIGVLLKNIHSHRAESTLVFFYLMLFGIFVSICITNFFGFSITVINVYWYILMGFLVLYNTTDTSHISNSNKTSFSQMGIVLVALLWMLNSIGTYWVADYTYAQSDIALKNNNVEASVALLQKALVLRKEHVYADKLSYALAQYAYTVAYQKDKEKSKEMIALAENLNLKSIQDSPQNVLYWKTRVKNQYIFYQMGLDKKYLFTGIAALEEASKLAPTDPKITYFAATYNSLLFDDEKEPKQKELYKLKSLDAIEKTITLKSDYGDAYLLKYQLLKKYKNMTAAKTLLEWYIPRYAPSNEELKKELTTL